MFTSKEHLLDNNHIYLTISVAHHVGSIRGDVIKKIVSFYLESVVSQQKEESVVQGPGTLQIQKHLADNLNIVNIFVLSSTTANLIK